MKYSITTPAKVNLYLNVLGPRDDGYHSIETVFMPVPGLNDTVTVEPNPGGLSVECSAPGVPHDSRNLCWQAVETFAAATLLTTDWRVQIEKFIPVAAGLGGGSSDAAAVLQLLNRVHGEPLAGVRLVELAAGLGADVAFFLDPTVALASGIGEVLRPAVCRLEFGLVLLGFEFPIPAAWAYGQLPTVDRPPAPSLDRFLEAMAQGDLAGAAACSYNALEFGVCAKFPIVEMAIESLLGNGCLAAHVSGSGPTVFGICAPGQTDRVCRASCERFGEGVWCHAEPAAWPISGSGVI